MPAMADKTIFNGAVPEMLISTAQLVADNTIEHHAAVKLPIKRPFLSLTNIWITVFIYYPKNPPAMPILKIFAPKAVMPPSWNIKHCTVSTVVIISTEAHGPSSMAMRVAPMK